MNYRWLIDKYKERKRILEYKIKPDSAIEVQDINYHYGEYKVIDSFSFSFKKNKIYAFLGKSGSGKSVLAAHFNGLLKSPTANIYLFNGENIYKFNKKIANFREIRKTTGMVLQNPEYQLFKETVLEDVCCGLKMLRVTGDISPEEKSKSKLLELGISEEFFGRNPFLLSGGQKKKIALAGILVIDPEIIIFDEPILGLDPFSSAKIVEMIENLRKQGKTIIVISNNIDLLLELGDEVLVLDKGKLIMHGTPYTIFRDSRLDLGVPKIIKFIDKLAKENPAFEALWDYEPKNFEELSLSIADVLRK
ncbi:energy-coupling factor transporter ATP-binding protein EcfA2 [Candidatus Mycoplasma haematohominis]|uniref:Energy-coupling factor transporter ATP-binding protein EcfA2 n=1 Tax=Candidatus Mycoplasma haematohominis TaxID=1494318 RepID=A0A478FQJ7_9MOLU|nr:energy-coupling factor transporter ATP-binding protein EcfA2 [Candidatus Mycoplasma haemohominis]